MEKNNYIVALDPGSCSITIAVGSPTKDGKLLLADIITKPMQGVTRGEITNRQQMTASLSEAIAEVEQKLEVRISDVYAGASGRHIKCTNHDYFVFVGEKSDGEIRQEDVAALHDGMDNVQAEEGVRIMERIPQSYIVDGRDSVKDPVGRFGKKLESTFNFVLGSSSLLDRMEKTLLALGIRSRKTFANALASAEAVVLPEEKEMGVAVIDMGAGTTDLCIYHDNIIRFVRGIPFGAADINQDIHQQGILEKHVEGLKKKFGVAMADLIEKDILISLPGRSPREEQEILHENLAIIIENRLKEMIGFVMAEIGDSGYGDKLKGGIVLTGGSAQMAGIDKLFRRETGMDVRIALPDVHVAEESIPMAQDPANATVIGILLKAIAEDKRAGTAGASYTPPLRMPAVEKPKPKEPKPKDSAPKEPETEDNNAPSPVDKKGRSFKNWLSGIGEKVADNFFPEILDGDEEM